MNKFQMTYRYIELHKPSKLRESVVLQIDKLGNGDLNWKYKGIWDFVISSPASSFHYRAMLSYFDV